MKDVNKVILVGRLGADPVQRSTKNGTSVIQMSLATSRRIYKEGSGSEGDSQYVDETQWHKVVVWGKQGEACAQYLKKGNTAYVEGFLKTRQYEDKDRVSKISVEVHADTVSFLGGRSESLKSEVIEQESTDQEIAV
jgi:single-strand DNA-binding protein